MSDHSAKKFPYLIIPSSSASSDKGDGDGVHSTRGKDNSKKREGRQRSHPRNAAEGTPYAGQGYLPFMEDNVMMSHANHAMNTNGIAHSTGQVSLNDFSTLNSISMTQMRAILTAQKELRKPACSLYPPASQISLIPETEMIYKKYFPTEAKESSIGGGIQYNKSQVPGNDKVPNKTENNDQINSKSAACASKSDTNVSNNCDNQNLTSGKSALPPTTCAVSGLNDKQAASKQRDAEARFKKRIQAQLVSLCAEVERQSADLSDMKKELKDLLTLSRKNSTDNDSSKSRLDTLSKHVNEIDNKMDSVQETISSQEKNLLSKLMLIGDLSDSDSDMDESNVKGVDALSCPSSTKIGTISSASRPMSSGSTDNFNLPKACCNWVPIAPDFDKLLQAVALLNYRMDRNQSMKLCTTNNGATFKHSDVIDLTIFKNGIILGSTGFRSYSTMSVIRFINEIFNGYLPTELTTQYPDGVVIVVNDKRSVIHSCDVNFNGSGTKLSVKELPNIIPGRGLSILHKQESLESIRPSTATSSGSLPASSISVTSFAGYRNGSYEMLPDLKGDEKNAKKKKVIMLKINERKNGLRFKLRVPINTQLKTLADHLGKVIPEREEATTSGNATDESLASTFKLYDIILPVPHGRLSCADSTLEEYGLTQNTLIYIEEKKS